ncbi:hypothetical protein CPT03_13740 [Pedobacter ginsengisoli]|uniref:Uncharacterized protein n=1 Tax=Pedobacter ginsengisoli TaxID=363852 RepID=A0A2D1U778_9SPHI|nr:hypothetical protein [Pedobacter ginsengisoli]ATP57459.1 hypothetical protein CPT03_13740 [Pedobacter ginsengisoli]
MTLRYIQPPEKLGEGFLKFAKEIHQKSLSLETKFTEEEIANFFNESFSGKIRANFLLWIGDLNRSIKGINIIVGDFSEIRADRNSLGGDPVIRSEFLFQAFFGEFFRLKEISKIFLKLLYKHKVLSTKEKDMLNDSYFKVFEWVYEVRNMIIHQGVTFKNYDVELPMDFLTDISDEEKAKFQELLENYNDRDGTVEIQCAFYTSIIRNIMNTFLEFQEKVGQTLAELILLYEEHAMSITVSDHADTEILNPGK